MFKCRRGTYDTGRRTAVPTLAMCAIALIPMTSAALADGDVIAQVRSDVARTNALTENVQLPLTMVWKTTTAAVPKTTQTPLYKNGIIYFALGKDVYAVRAADGTTLWTYSGSSTFNATPAMSDDALFIGCDDAHLYKLNLNDGSVIWSKAFGGPLRSSPAIADGHLYFGDEDGDVYNVNASTGSTYWTFQASGAVSTPIAMTDDGKLFFAAADSNVYCLSSETGHEEWQLLFQGDLGATSPCYANDTFYVASGRTLYALNPNHGAIRWQVDFGGQISCPPTVGVDNIYVTTDQNKLVALNVHGNILWSKNIGLASAAPALLAGDTVILAADHGAIYAFDADSGARKWDYVVQPSGTRTKPAGVDLCSTPIFADNTLYVLGDDGSLSAFRNQALDQAGPVIYNVTPTPGSSISEPSLNFAATVVDEGSGIAPGTLSMTVDGKPVTAITYDAGSNGVRTTVDPLAIPGPNTPSLPHLSNGAHTVVMTIADWKGNSISKTWGFMITNADAKTAAEQALADHPPIPDAPPDDDNGGGAQNGAGSVNGGGNAQQQPANTRPPNVRPFGAGGAQGQGVAPSGRGTVPPGNPSAPPPPPI